MKVKKIKFSSRYRVYWAIKIFSILMIAFNICAAKVDKAILKDINIENSDKDDVKIVLNFSILPKPPKIFSIDNPPELIVDFPDTINGLTKDKMNNSVSSDLVKNVNFLYSNNKTRMAIKLTNLLPYTLENKDNNLIFIIKNQAYESVQTNPKSSDNYTIHALDFNRGLNGEGKLTLDLKLEVNDIDIKENNNEIIVNFKNATISEKLLRNFDVGDFGTPIKNIIFSRPNKDLILNIKTKGEYEKIAYHLDGKYIIEARPKDFLSQQLDKARKFKFTGEKISLNFQDIEIRAVLQLLADFTGMNIIANDSVNGNVTLRLENIPWDQALDFILKSKGLAKRESGNVVLIAPTEELSKYEEMELSSLKQVEALAPLKTEFIKINYAKADDIIKMIKDGDKNSMLSSRGTVSVDSRTNTLLLKEIEDKISDIKDLIKILDVAVKQVLIEAYIVSVTESFSDDFGVKLNTSAGIKLGGRRLGLSQSADDALSIANQGIGAMNGIPKNFFDPAIAGSTLGLALSRLPKGLLLSLELQAAEIETLATTIAKPRILTLDKQAASIESGQDIPYQTASLNTGTNTTFQKASIKLQVTPQITPNNQISMDISINNDEPGAEMNGSVAISTNSLKTNILVDDGETVVLGGLLKDKVKEGIKKVPYLSKIPLLGALFQARTLSEDKNELLVFITPRIVASTSKDQEDNNY